MSVVGLGTTSEVGALRIAILHRPGAELSRLSPRNIDQLLFDGLPWVARAQEEHDRFAELLRSRGVEVLLLSDLLTGRSTTAAPRGCRAWRPRSTPVGSERLWRKSFRPTCAAWSPVGWRRSSWPG